MGLMHLLEIKGTVDKWLMAQCRFIYSLLVVDYHFTIDKPDHHTECKRPNKHRTPEVPVMIDRMFLMMPSPLSTPLLEDLAFLFYSTRKPRCLTWQPRRGKEALFVSSQLGNATQTMSFNPFSVSFPDSLTRLGHQTSRSPYFDPSFKSSEKPRRVRNDAKKKVINQSKLAAGPSSSSASSIHPSNPSIEISQDSSNASGEAGKEHRSPQELAPHFALLSFSKPEKLQSNAQLEPHKELIEPRFEGENEGSCKRCGKNSGNRLRRRLKAERRAARRRRRCWYLRCCSRRRGCRSEQCCFQAQRRGCWCRRKFAGTIQYHRRWTRRSERGCCGS